MFLTMFAELGQRDAILMRGDGQAESFDGTQPCVVVFRPGQSIRVLTPPAGTKLEEAQVMTASRDGESGVISVAFTPEETNDAG